MSFDARPGVSTHGAELAVWTHFVNVNFSAAAFAALLVDHGYRIFHPTLLA